MRYCIGCRSINKKKIIDLSKIPMSNEFVSKKKLNNVKKYNLGLDFCKKCFLIQNSNIIDNKKIFNKKYLYHSSYSSSWLRHSEKLVNKCIKDFKLNKKSKILEIASNDGYLLQFFKKKKIQCFGIEPSLSVAKIAKKKNIPTFVEFFSSKFAKKLNKRIKPNIIIALNVLAHTPKLKDFVKALSIMMGIDTVCIIEVPYLINLIKKNQVDTIYHEHYSYFSVISLCNILNKLSLKIFDVQFLKTHGGSLRLYLKIKSNKTYIIKKIVSKILSKEKKLGMNKMSFYKNFNSKINKINKINKRKIEIISKNKKLIGYGAAAKSTILCNILKLTTNNIKFVVDKNKFKINKYIPGSNIPILDVKNIKKFRPDYILIFPWNLKKEIISQLKFTRKWGAKFLICNPTLRVLNSP